MKTCKGALVLGTMMALVLVLYGCQEPTQTHQFGFGTMGTEASCNFMLPAHLAAEQSETIVRETFSQVNTALSTWSGDSEISRLNRAPADSAVALSPALHTCLLVSRDLFEKSGGAFDPTAGKLMRLWGFYRRQGILPSTAELDSALADLGQWELSDHSANLIKGKPGTTFDLGGIAKGLAVDMAVSRLRAEGMRNGLIDLGGNLYCFGGATGRKDWRVGIRNPRNRDELFATVTISDQSVATSGSYERFVEIDGRRYGHIMNPATGHPAEGLLSATVIATEGILADGLSTTLFVMGPEKALQFLQKHYPEVDAVLVIPGAAGAKDQVLITPRLEGRIALIAGFEDQYEIVIGQSSAMFSSNLQSTQLPQSISRGGE